MSAMFSSSQDEISFSRTTGYARSPSRNLLSHNRYPYTKALDQQFIQRSDGVYRDTRRDTKARPRRSTNLSALPIYLQRWLATKDSDDEDNNPLTADQDSMDIDTNNGYTPFEQGHCSPGDPHYARLPVPAGKPLCQDESLEEDLISKYLNLDHEPSTSEDSMISTGVGSPSTSSDASTSPSSTIEDARVAWEINPRPTSLSENTTGSEIEVDTNGVGTRNLRPWGDYAYKPYSPPGYFDEEDYAREHELARIEAELRVRLAEHFAREAIYGTKGVKSKKRRGKKKVKGVEVQGSFSTVAFSRVIPGRTIYNP